MPQKRMTILNPRTNSYVSRKRTVKLTRKSVLKMLAVMEASQSAAGPSSNNKDQTGAPTESTASAEDFLQSGRTGRRNALADILGEHAAVTSSDLPSRLEGLSTKDKNDTKNNEPNSSSKS